MALDDLRIKCMYRWIFHGFVYAVHRLEKSRFEFYCFPHFLHHFNRKCFTIFIYVRDFFFRNGFVFLCLHSIFLYSSWHWVAVVAISTSTNSIDAHWLWSDCHNNAIQIPESAYLCATDQKDNCLHWNVEKQMRGISISYISISAHRAIVTHSGKPCVSCLIFVCASA